MKNRCIPWLVAAFLLCVSTNSYALPAFYKVFKEKYGEGDAEPALKQSIETAKCAVCHTAPKPALNDYGAATGVLLAGAAFPAVRLKAEPENVKREILAALKKVEEAKNINGETYGAVSRPANCQGAGRHRAAITKVRGQRSEGSQRFAYCLTPLPRPLSAAGEGSNRDVAMAAVGIEPTRGLLPTGF
jgi:hypothetical protein